ncbi:MAG: transposase [Anaerolineales bacterium]
MRKEKTSRSWTRVQRLDALLETHGLSDEERGAWCRERGVHSHQLEHWRRELIEGAQESGESAVERRTLREENRALKKELRRKDKALAETAALLVLKKKAAAIWGENEGE